MPTELGLDRAESSQMAGKSPWWRSDVQGLRAVAVLGVVAYHAGLPIPGGFTGVDVFFVISGFVIGGLLLRELQKSGRVSPKTFYLRRARRLLPAVAVMIVVVVLLSAVLITPLGDAQNSAGAAASAASVFLSNLYFLVFTGGYFQPGTEANPLLHTWSLSVEEQFYLVLPWLLVLGWVVSRRSKLRTTAAIVSLGWMASLLACLVFSYPNLAAELPVVGARFAEWPSVATQAAFYSPVTRSWEFLSGVGIILIGIRWRPPLAVARLMGAAGLAVVILGFALIREGGNFPGLWALIPVSGTAMLVLAGNSIEPTGVTRGLSTRPLVLIGNVSYGWYLWHWPIIVFAAMWFSQWWVPILAALLSLGPTIASFRLLEQPIHARKWLPGNRHMALASVAFIVVPFLAGVALMGAWGNSWWRADIAQIQAATSRPHLDTVKGCSDIDTIGPGSGSCLFESAGATQTVLLIGDSNAGMYVEPMVAAASALGVNLEVATRNACPIVSGGDYGTEACRSFVGNSIDYILRRDPPYAAVVVVNSGKYPIASSAAFAPAASDSAHGEREKGISGYANAVAGAVREIDEVSPVVLVAPIPQSSGGEFPGCMLKSVVGPIDRRCTTFDAEFIAFNRTQPVAAVLAAVGDSATIWDPALDLCQTNGSCSMYRDGVLVYRDDSHLSVDGSLAYSEDLERILAGLLAQSSDSP